MDGGPHAADGRIHTNVVGGGLRSNRVHNLEASGYNALAVA